MYHPPTTSHCRLNSLEYLLTGRNPQDMADDDNAYGGLAIRPLDDGDIKSIKLVVGQGHVGELTLDYQDTFLADEENVWRTVPPPVEVGELEPDAVASFGNSLGCAALVFKPEGLGPTWAGGGDTGGLATKLYGPLKSDYAAQTSSSRRWTLDASLIR